MIERDAANWGRSQSASQLYSVVSNDNRVLSQDCVGAHSWDVISRALREENATGRNNRYDADQGTDLSMSRSSHELEKSTHH